MFNLIDKYLNRITMYRLVLYYLATLVAISIVLSFFNLFIFQTINLVITIFIIFIVCFLTNKIFVFVYKVPVNIESVYITALILILIITPPVFENYISDLMFLFWVSVWSMASKYIFTYNKKHIFNPVVFSTILISFTLNQSVSWWVGNFYLFPFVLIGGILVVKKIRHLDLVFSFLIIVLSISITLSLIKGAPVIINTMQLISYSPLLFFAFIMITEPLTTPPTKGRRIIYGGLVGLLFAPMSYIGLFHLTPESALLIGNLYSFIISPKGRYFLKLKEKNQLSSSVYNLVFSTENKFNFKPGQYLEWTLGHGKPDNRGNRRYLTIASSPTEPDIQLGVKFYPNSSSYKQTLFNMNIGEQISASQLAGDFVLPKDPKQKLIFIAGGIGVTPFRSMIKYLIDKQEKRSIVLFYSNNIIDDIVYSEIFQQAEPLGVKTVYTLTDVKNIPDSWNGYRDFINEQIIIKESPDYKDRIFYISGPPIMVQVMSKMLKKMGVAKKQIKTDFFPGLV